MSEPARPRVAPDQGKKPVLLVRHTRFGVPIGIRYERENPEDRDAHGVLWSRASRPGSPEADERVVRRRQLMQGLRCRDCGGPASRTKAGWLFLEFAGGRPERMLTAHPPVCLAHAATGIRDWRHPRGWTLLRSKAPERYGVLGALHAIHKGRLVEMPRLVIPGTGEVPVAYTHRTRTPWVLASALVRCLTRITVVRDPDQELTAAQETAQPADPDHSEGNHR
jgi:hypothetical protein